MPIISAFPTGESTVDYTGPKSGLPSLEEGKVAYVTDEKRLYTGNADGTNTQVPNADDLSVHTSNKENPHNVTADQVGAAAKDLSNVQFGLAFEAATLPGSTSWGSVCYGDGKFVAVAYSSDKAAYSTDGITWTAVTLPSSANWQSVCHGNGKFVAVADSNNTAVYSTDGITWTATTLPSSAKWGSVCYGNGKFVAVANSSDKAAYSTDGITWTAATLSSSADWFSVCYGDGKFVAVAYSSDKAAYSTDGINWTKVTLPSSDSWQSVTYGNGKFVAVANNSATAAYSTDGINWTVVTLPSSASWYSVTFGNGKFVAVARGSDAAACASDVVDRLIDAGLAKAPSACKVTLSASGWDSSAKTQSATVSGVLEDESKQLIMPMPAGTSMSAYNAAGIQMTAQAANTVTFTADTVPTADVEVWVVVQSVNDVTPPPPLDQASWAYISQQSLAGKAKNIWAVGDCKKIKLSGIAGELSLDTELYVYILDFDHDSSTEDGAKDGITFGTFKTALTDGIDVALHSSSGFEMNPTDTNAGGWKDSNMRYNILGSTDTENDNPSETVTTYPVGNSLMSCLPADLRAVMRPMCIYTDNTGGGSNTASYVTTTIDFLPLLAEFEINGTLRLSNSEEKNKQTQYTYFKNGNPTTKYQHAEQSTTANWWCRSPYAYAGTLFSSVNGSGSANGSDASNSNGVAPMFKV